MGSVTSTALASTEASGEFQLADHAYTSLLGAIARSELAPGAWLNERDASAALGMSRTPFRQALHRLALDGLIQIVPRRGARVALLDLKDIQDNIEVRQALESAAVRKAIREGRPFNVDRLEELVAIMRTATRDGDPPAFLEADEKFHLTVAAAGGNTRVLEALAQAWIHINRARYLEPPDKAAMRESTRQHTEILNAIRAGKVRHVESTMSGHMQSTGDLFGDLRRKFPEAFTT